MKDNGMKINKENTIRECICGHSIDDHHGSCVLFGRSEYIYKSMVYLECEHDFFFGDATSENPCRCNKYFDKGWFFY